MGSDRLLAFAYAACRLPSSAVERPVARALPTSANALPNSLDAPPEARIEERRDIRVGGRASEQMDTVELSRVSGRDEGHVELRPRASPDAKVREELGLDVGGDASLSGPGRSVVLYRMVVSKPFGYPAAVRSPCQGRGRSRTRPYGAAVRDGARAYAVAISAFGRKSVVDDVLAIDADRDGLPHLLVVERRVGVVEAR